MVIEWSYRFLDALFFSIDGNFVSHQKLKKSDPNDFPLTKGASYFMHEDDLSKFLKNSGPYKREVRIKILTYTTFSSSYAPQHSTCHKFNAMGYVGYVGKVSGVIMLSCSRHMFVLPGSGVDLQKGERCVQLYADTPLCSLKSPDSSTLMRRGFPA